MTPLEFFDIDRQRILSHLLRLLIAYLLALPIGLNREKSERHFGMRTFPLVAVVTCGFMMVGMSVIDTSDGEARVIQGIITGIGFIGGGAIYREKDGVAGMASAASIWNTGAIGVATAFSRFEIAIVLSIINVVTLSLVGRVKKNLIETDDDG